MESASAAASDVTNAMMSVKVELEEKKKTNELLQRALVYCLMKNNFKIIRSMKIKYINLARYGI